MKIIAFLVFFGASVSLSQPHIEQANINPPLPQDPPQGWYKQESGTTAYLPQLSFVNKDTGWVAGADALYGTTDGGNTWSVVNPISTYGVQFIDGHRGYVAVASGGLLKTSDGGKSGEIIAIPFGGKLQLFGMDTIYIFNKTKLAFARSVDGGKSWKLQDTGLARADEGAMSFAHAKHGFLCGRTGPWFGTPPPSKGTVGAGFMTTSDGGITWHDKYCPIQEDLHAIFAVDSLHLYVAGFTNIFYSSDGGITWKQKLDQGGNTTTFYFFNAAMGYAVGGSEKIYFTSDTGATWTIQNTTVSSYLYSVCFVDSLNGWASGEDGTIIHTVNGGTSSVRQFLPTPTRTSVSPEPFAQKTTITYSLPEPSKATIRIYDITGRELQVMESPGIQEAGKHTIEFDAIAYPSGAFYYRLEAQGVCGAGKMTKIAQ